MTQPRIERIATDLLAEHEVVAPPIPIDEIATSAGARIVRHSFSGSESGFALRDGDQWIIGVNSATSPRRQRFSVAHELGHLLLHKGRPLIVDHALYISKRDAVSSMGTDLEEIQANGFAAAILMPRNMIVAEVRRIIDSGEPTSRNELVANLARTFDVSVEAMSYRLLNLNIISA